MRYFLLFVCIFLPISVLGAQITVSPSSDSLGTGEVGIAHVSLYTEGAMVNAIEGVVEVPSSLSVVEIRFAQSIVPYWIEPPHQSAPGVISFAGMLPGGYQNGIVEKSSEGNLFTIVLMGEEVGEGVFTITPSTVAYLNDGEGTPLALEKKGAHITVTDAGSGVGVSVNADTEPPELFDLDLLDGSFVGQKEKVVVFSAIDKDSGIAGYEIARSIIWLPEFLRSYKEVTSPAPMEPGDVFGIVWVRAQDHYHNYTTARITPSGIFGYIPSMLFVILICVLLYRIILRKKAIMNT